MTTVLATLALIIPIFFFYSPRVEQNRIVTISRPLVITQERKTPAYYLYQQAQASETPQKQKPVMTTYLSTQNYIPATEHPIAVNEMKINRREISSDVDAGFRAVAVTTAVAPEMMPKVVYDYQMANNQQAIPSTPKTNLNPTLNQSPANKWATVRGKFELRDGVGIVDHIIEIKRVEEGQIRETGRVDLKAGLYSIDIASPQGYLIAEIKDRNGSSIGEDRQQIINLKSHGQYFEGPFIQVHRPAVIAANPVSPPNLPTRKTASTYKVSAKLTTSLFSNQNVLEKPNDQFSNISRGSSTIAQVADLSQIYKTIVSIRQTADENETPIFTNKWVEGIIEYISDQQKIEFKSNKAPMIIGRAMVDQKTAAGIQVQIENHPGIHSIYFDQFMIPNLKQTETSENGYFMFVGLEEENYEVAAFKANKLIGHQLFITEQDAISYQNISTTTAASNITIRVFDAFSADPIEADVVSPDVEEMVEAIGGSAIYRTQNNLGLSQFLVRTNQQGYVPVRYIQDARKEFVHVPMIQEVWLKSLAATRMLNEQPETGMIVGFVPDFDFEAYLISEEYSKDQVIYFDQQGQISQTPVRGGGFALFNVPIGAREVVVQEKNSERIYSQVFDVKINQVSVSHFSE